MEDDDLFDKFPGDNRPDNDWFVVFMAGLVCAVVILGAFSILKYQKWLENPGEYIPVASPVVQVRTEYVPSPSPVPVPGRRVTVTKTPSVPAPVTETVTVQVPGENFNEACVEALNAADALKRAIEQGGDVDGAVYAYEVFRSMCKGL